VERREESEITHKHTFGKNLDDEGSSTILENWSAAYIRYVSPRSVEKSQKSPIRILLGKILMMRGVLRFSRTGVPRTLGT
jgi:hypothetical protein